MESLQNLKAAISRKLLLSAHSRCMICRHRMVVSEQADHVSVRDSGCERISANGNRWAEASKVGLKRSI